MRDTVLNMLAECVMCQLSNSPAADDMGVVLDTYMDVFERHGLGGEDGPRLGEAFMLWIKTESRFPTPADIIRSLPQRRHYPQSSKQLSHDTAAAKVRSNALAREHLGKWRAIAASAWRYREPWTEELKEKYCIDLAVEPEDVAKALSQTMEKIT